MKTSKIIFISFFSIIGLFLLSLLIQTNPKNRGNKELREMKKDSIALPPFSHLIINEGSTVRLSSGIADSIKIGYKKDLQMVHPIYTSNGDTLTINSYPEDKGYYTELICKNLNSIILYHARLDIDNFMGDSLKVEGISSAIDINNLATFQSLNIHLQAKSWLWCNFKSIEFIRLRLEGSHSELNIDRLHELKAELADSSELSISKALHSDVITDETSSFYIR